MGGLRLRLAAAIDHPQARYGARVVVSPTSLLPEAGIANLSIYQDLHDTPLLLFFRRVQERQGLRIRMGRIQFQTYRVRGIERLRQPMTNDVAELDLGDRPNRMSLQGAADQRSLGDEVEPTLVEAGRSFQRNDLAERQKVLHPSVGMPRKRGIRIDARDAGSRKIATPPSTPAWCPVDDPVSGRLSGLGQVTIRKMVPGLDFIVVSRPGS